ncbi:MAG: restriction endonuclease subunit S, partial [Thermoplasmatales archaeon]|nr:restriction endonuclease subunit S [Thermoplasmatales archaeon]
MKSEIEVPDGWNVKRLDEITTIIISNVDKKINENETPVSLCNYKDVYDNHYINSKLNFMNGTAKKVEIGKFTLLKNDVIITKDSETKFDIANSSVVIEELKNVICGYHLAILRPMPSILNGIFLMNVLKIKPVNNHFVKYAQGLTRFGLTVDAINRAKIPLPPFEEQQKIADILLKVDEQIDFTEKIIEKTEGLKKGLIWKLLTNGIGHDRFRDRKIGLNDYELPGTWEVKTIEETSFLKGRIGWQGLTTKEYLSEGDYILVTGTDFKDGRINWDTCVYVEEDRYLMDPYIQLKNQDILVTKDGTIGKIAYADSIPKPATLNSGVFVLRPLDGAYHPKFFYYILKS